MTDKKKAEDIASILVDTDQVGAYKRLVALILQCFKWKETQVITNLKKKGLLIMRPTDSFYKIHEAGFKIIRADDAPSPRIKEWKSNSAWVTMEKFDTKAARDRRMQQLLQEPDIVTL